MELHTFTWGANRGWSMEPPSFASGNPLVLAFGGREATARTAIQQLVERYPAGSICGCSGAGEIFGGSVSDDQVTVAALQFERGHHRAVWGPSERAADSERVGRSLDEQAYSLTFAGDVPRGYRVQLMRANLDRLIQGAEEAAAAANQSAEGSGSTLAIAINCVGRRLVLGERAEEELEASLAGLPTISEA